MRVHIYRVWEDARAYVIYTNLDEVDKSVVHGLMIVPNLLQDAGSPFSLRTDRIDRIFVTQFLEQLHARMRRGLEVLVNLVLFSQTNDQSYYRHFLLLEELDNLLGANLDLQEFHGCRSTNMDDSIARLAERIRQTETGIDSGRCWYLHDKKSLSHGVFRLTYSRSDIADTGRLFAKGYSEIPHHGYSPSR